MAKQLDQLWKAVNRQQSEKLLHQIASGMAHQLRNSLTGARMAIELHARHCSQGRQEELQVAITQLEQLEEYIRRLLWVGTGQPTQDQPTCIAQCIEDLKSSLGSVARHLQRQLVWSVSEVPEQFVIKDGPIFSAALTNLIWNAMQAGRNVLVSATMVADDDHRQLSLLEVVVTDDGPGIPDSIAGSLFEPFVSTKPEGLGLGLPFVQRAAEILGGEVQWRRREESTQFILRIRVSQEAPK
jgi:signal transduction histidine kinase